MSTVNDYQKLIYANNTRIETIGKEIERLQEERRLAYAANVAHRGAISQLIEQAKNEILTDAAQRVLFFLRQGGHIMCNHKFHDLWTYNPFKNTWDRESINRITFQRLRDGNFIKQGGIPFRHPDAFVPTIKGMTCKLPRWDSAK